MVHHRNLKSQDPTGSAVDVIKFKVNATIKQFETCTKELINYVLLPQKTKSWDRG